MAFEEVKFEDPCPKRLGLQPFRRNLLYMSSPATDTIICCEMSVACFLFQMTTNSTQMGVLSLLVVKTYNFKQRKFNTQIEKLKNNNWESWHQLHPKNKEQYLHVALLIVAVVQSEKIISRFLNIFYVFVMSPSANRKPKFYIFRSFINPERRFFMSLCLFVGIVMYLITRESLQISFMIFDVGEFLKFSDMSLKEIFKAV